MKHLVEPIAAHPEGLDPADLKAPTKHAIAVAPAWDEIDVLVTELDPNDQPWHPPDFGANRLSRHPAEPVLTLATLSASQLKMPLFGSVILLS